MLKVKQFLTRAAYVFKNRNGANEIIGSALLMVYTVLAVIPSIMSCAHTIDTAIQSLDNQLSYYLTEGVTQNTTPGGGGGSTSQNTYVVNLTLNQSPIIIPKLQNGGGYINFSIPPGVPPNAIKVEVEFTFDYVFYDPVNSTVFEQGTKTVKYGFDFLDNSSYYEDSFDFSPNYFDVTGNFDPYMVFYDAGTNSYTVTGALSIDNSLCEDALKIIPKSEYITFYYQ